MHLPYPHRWNPLRLDPTEPFLLVLTIKRLYAPLDLFLANHPAHHRRLHASNSKRVVVDGEQDDSLETDQEGRKAALLLTPEEMAQLGQAGGDSTGAGKAGASPAADDAKPGSEQPSPSINAPTLPPSIN